MMKKYIIILVAIIIVCSIILFNKVTNKQEEEKYGRAEIISLLEKGKDYNNYYCEYELDGEKTVRKVIGNKMVAIGEKTTQYIDYDNDSTIIISNNSDLVIKHTYTENDSLKLNKAYFQEAIDYLKNFEKYKFEYLGKEKYKEFECIKVKVYKENANYELYIDEVTGLVIKADIYNDKGGGTLDYNVRINCITDEEMKVPDLSKYRMVEQ